MDFVGRLRFRATQRGVCSGMHGSTTDSARRTAQGSYCYHSFSDPWHDDAMVAPALPLDARFQISSQQVFTQVQGSAVILSLSTNQYYSLDAIGSVIWQALQQPVTLLALRDQICSAYEVDPARCLSDLTTLLNRLLEEQLVVRLP